MESFVLSMKYYNFAVKSFGKHNVLEKHKQKERWN